ncbi:MAG: ATP-binding cassette domain-containing protein [Treponema sp.]|nr:ATP-binding cassette domain-containing protein [Treponema sp.]
MKESLILEIKGLCLKAGPLVIINNFSLELERGKILGLYSPTGSGKTSILNYIAGLLDKKLIQSGSLELASDTLISYAFQNFRLLENLSVYENLKVPLTGRIKEEVPDLENKINSILNSFGLIEKKNLKASFLSGGEKQRLSLARALIFPSNLLLIDEAFNALSEDVKKDCLLVTKNLLQNRSAILVSHCKSDLEFLCNSIISLNNCK